MSEETRESETDGAGSFMRTERTTLKRLPKRGSYERQTVYDILDEGFVCHVGFVSGDRPVVIPTAYGRIEDRLYLHGARASRMLKTLAAGVDVCVNVTLVDGLVLARSVFHHSMNYRSVVIFGRAHAVESDKEKESALLAFTEHIVPGRWEEVRGPSKQELDSTLVLSLPLDEASAKVRTGPPLDDEEDYELPIWAGVLPLRVSAGDAVADPRLGEGTPPPGWLEGFDPARRQES